MSQLPKDDVTLAALRQELACAKAAAAAAEAKANLFAGVIHDLRTPLTMILGPLEEMLGVGGVPSLMRRGLRRMHRNAHRLFRLVEHLLEMSRASSGVLVPAPEPVDIRALIADIFEDARAVADAKGIALTFRCEGRPSTVEIDALMIERIAINLVSNALDFTPAGGQVDIDVAIGEGEVTLVVRDSGVGIAESDLPRIFDRFAQGYERRPGRRGAGLGLALVKELTQLLGGRVDVVSEEGEGTAFTVTVPAPRAGEPAERRSPAAGRFAHQRLATEGDTDTGRSRPELGPKPRVLVADDNDEMRQYIADLLADEAEVVAVSSGEEAWEQVQTRAFNLILTDVMMDRLGGFELVERVKTNPLLAAVPIIVVTARGGSEAALGLDIGADDYLAKPFAPVELRARVRAALRAAAALHELRDRAHLAGMAELAAGLVHDLGDTLRQVSESVTVIEDQLATGWATASLEQMVKKLTEAEQRGLSDTNDQYYLPVYLNTLAKQLATEQKMVAGEIKTLRGQLVYADGVLANHSELSRYAGMTEMVVPSQLLQEAVALAAESLAEIGVDVRTEADDDRPVGVERHPVLDMLVHVINNAQESLARVDVPRRVLTLRVEHREPYMLALIATDSGVGLSKRELSRVFEPDYSGYGAGLHRCAVIAQRLGGQVSCHSDGTNKGATVTIEIPFLAITDAE